MDEQKWLRKAFVIEPCYIEIQKLIEQYGPPSVFLNGRPIYNAAFLIEFFNLALKNGSEYSLPPQQKECYKDNITEYNYGNMETIMLMIGLTSLSWLSLNIERKTEEGHCKNPSHDLKD